jgi:short subunit dehydrogenase-like uncharacterized protein
MKERRWDIILFGATGFTGQLIARFLAEHAHEAGWSFALAGRNEAKGAALIASLPDYISTAWITADVHNGSALEVMASQGRVVMNAAGPFAEYGPAVVKACVRSGTHYLDITGEPSFVAETIEKHHKEAIENEVAIVHACGFDSIPADLGTLLAVQGIKDKSRIDVWCFIRTNAQFSGGTWTTAIKALTRQNERKSSPSEQPRSKSRRLPLKVHFNKDVQRWALPMPVLDPHIVKRSSRSMTEAYGSSFAYAQFFTVGTFGKMLKILGFISSLFLLTRFKWGRRWLLGKNKPGTGPDEERRARSRFEVTIIARGGEEESKVVFAGHDPGYNETSKMFSLAAFHLLGKAMEGKLPSGVCTTATALGLDFLDKLRTHGIRIEHTVV